MSQDSAGMHDATRSRTPPRPVDNTDWLKTFAIICVSAGHFGFFFMEDERWWSAFGRFAAPPFFFLVGYAQSRTVPLHWIWIGIILTLLESSNADWTWVAPNILLSLALIRLARPYVQMLVQRHGWVAFVLLVSTFLAVLPVAAKIALVMAGATAAVGASPKPPGDSALATRCVSTIGASFIRTGR